MTHRRRRRRWLFGPLMCCRRWREGYNIGATMIYPSHAERATNVDGGKNVKIVITKKCIFDKFETVVSPFSRTSAHAARKNLPLTLHELA